MFREYSRSTVNATEKSLERILYLTKFSGQSGDPDYRIPDYRGTPLFTSKKSLFLNMHNYFLGYSYLARERFLFTEVHIESNSAKFPEFASSKC
jgi:hypothetical protein